MQKMFAQKRVCHNSQHMKLKKKLFRYLRFNQVDFTSCIRKPQFLNGLRLGFFFCPADFDTCRHICLSHFPFFSFRGGICLKVFSWDLFLREAHLPVDWFIFFLADTFPRFFSGGFC